MEGGHARAGLVLRLQAHRQPADVRRQPQEALPSSGDEAPPQRELRVGAFRLGLADEDEVAVDQILDHGRREFCGTG